MSNYEVLHDILVKLFQEILDIERKALITSEFKDISVNDMHIIEAIGEKEPKNMSSVAKIMSVTVGTLTIAVNSLVKKGYVKRERSEQDRRVVYIMLTSKGKLAYRHHEAFHRKMTEALVENLSQEDTELLVRAMTNLKNFFESYRKNESESQRK